MAIVQRQKSSTTSTIAGTSLSRTWSPAPEVGSLLLAVANSSTNITGPSGWELAASAVNVQRTYIWYRIATASEGSVTITYPSAYAQLAVFEYIGVDTLNPLDQTASNSTAASVTSLSTGTTPAMAQPTALVMACMGVAATAAFLAQDFSAWSNSFVEEFDLWATTSNTALGVASLLATTTGGHGTTATWSSAAAAGGAVATFREAPTPTSRVVKEWTGSTWQPRVVKEAGTEARPVRHWDGQRWV